MRSGRGPFGNLVTTIEPAGGYSAGGIGITIPQHPCGDPHEKLPQRIFLFYSNRRPEDAPFLDELHDLMGIDPNFTFIPTMTQMSDSRRPWAGEIGYIDYQLIVKHLQSDTSSGKNLLGPIYYMAGPPAMVAALRAMLNIARSDDDDIRTEEFTGY